MNKKFTAVILALSVSLQSAGLLYARESAGNGDLTEMTGQAVVQEYDMEAYENNEVLVLYKDGSCTTKTYSSKEELKNALYEMSKDELIDIVQPNYLYSSTAYRTDD